MRKISFLAVMILLVTSCAKESLNNKVVSEPDEIVTLKVAPNESGTISLFDASDAKIDRQPTHSLVSEIFRNNEDGNLTYKYTPAKDYSGTDEVVLFSTRTIYSSDNTGSCRPGSNETTSTILNQYITVKITVGN
jgi:hypothetical protein